MLETGIDDKEVKVRAIIDDAISAIIEMDSKRAPADKLKTLVDSSKLLFEAIHASSGKQSRANAIRTSKMINIRAFLVITYHFLTNAFCQQKN